MSTNSSTRHLVKAEHEATPMSTIDVCPTLCNLAGVPTENVKQWRKGESLIPTSNIVVRRSLVAMENAAEALYAPLVSLRNGKLEYNPRNLDPEQLLDLENDSNEINDLVEQPEYEKILSEFQKMADKKWGLDRFDEGVRGSCETTRI